MTNTETIARWHAGTLREITGVPDERTVTMERRYDFPADAVWDAWTNPERLARWLGSVSGELRLGSEVLLDMAPGEPGEKVPCEITACEPPRRLAVLWRHPGEPESAAELRLTPDEGGTILRIEHARLPGDLSADYGYGWEDFLDRLGALLTDGDPDSVSWEKSQGVLRPMWEAAAQLCARSGIGRVGDIRHFGCSGRQEVPAWV